MKAFLSLGTNMGNRTDNLKSALNLLEKNGCKILKQSSIYETQPWGFNCDQWFLNMVVQVETGLEPFQLLETTQNIERQLGRTQKSNGSYRPRIIDIDILLYEQVIIVTDRLTIPHKHLHRRKFVLAPLAEIAPNLIHPLLDETMEKLLANCSDTTTIRLYSTLQSESISSVQT